MTPRIEFILRGGKRIHGEGTRRVRVTLTAEILTLIIPHISNDKDGINLKAALCVAFAGFLQSWWVYVDNLEHTIVPVAPCAKTYQIQHNGSAPSLKNRSIPPRHTHPPLPNYIHPLPSPSSLRTIPNAFPTTRQPALLTNLWAIQSNIPCRQNQGTPASSRHQFNKNLRALTAKKSGSLCSETRHFERVTDIKLLGRWKSDAIDTYLNELAEEDQITKLLQLNSRLHSP